MSTRLKLGERINKVTDEVRYLKKDTKVKAGGGYMGMSHDAVAAALQGPMAKWGLVSDYELTSVHEELIERTGSNGKRMVHRITVVGNYYIYASDDDNPNAVRRKYGMVGIGEDNMDKGPGKAVSYACKMALLKAFMLESGDRDEDRESDDDGQTVKVARLGKARGKKLADLLAEKGLDYTTMAGDLDLPAKPEQAPTDRQGEITEWIKAESELGGVGPSDYPLQT